MGQVMKRIWSIAWRLMLGALILLFLVPTVVPPFLDHVYYRGPISNHFDGQRFFNPDGEQGTGGAQKRSLAGIWLRLQRLDAKAPWPKHLAVPVGRPWPRPSEICPNSFQIKSIRPAITYACNSFGPTSGFLPEDFPNTRKTRIIELDTINNLGHFSDGIVIPLHPFFGSVGVAPPSSFGRVNSAPPGIFAGNLDNKELVAGTTLFIPVWAKGALLNIGDGHAGQGNGEVDITAMETSLTGRLQLIVHKNQHLQWPRAETPTHYIAMGTDSALVKATKTAVREAIQLLVDMKGMKREDAYQLVSVSSDVDITQLVDGTVGVHVMIPKRIFVH